MWASQVTWQVYRAEEIEVDPARMRTAVLFSGKGAAIPKYAIVIGGNAMTISGTFGEGLSTAWELHEKGYTVFVLRYRGMDRLPTMHRCRILAMR